MQCGSPDGILGQKEGTGGEPGGIQTVWSSAKSNAPAMVLSFDKGAAGRNWVRSMQELGAILATFL